MTDLERSTPLDDATGLVEPVPGSTLTGPIQVFRWDLGGRPLDRASLLVGEAPGRTDYLWRNVGTDTETSVGGLPIDGSTVHVRLWVEVGGRWQIFDASYPTSTSPRRPAFVQPTPESTLSGPSETFGFDLAGLPVDDTWLYIGSRPGASDVAVVRPGPLTANDLVAVGGLPTDGSDLYVRLFLLVAGIWHLVDARYRATSAPTTSFPSRDRRARELQRLVGVATDGVIGPLTIRALNQNWLGRADSFDPAFAARFVDQPGLVEWVQRGLNHWFDAGLEVSGRFDGATEAAAVQALGRGGVIAAESYSTLLEGPSGQFR